MSNSLHELSYRQPAEVETTRKRSVITGRTANEIARSIRAAVDEGALERGQSLPTVRTLADELGVNRNTVAAAYKQLSEVGIIEGRGRQGSRIAGRIAGRPQVVDSSRDLSGGNPDPNLLPDMRLLMRDVGAQNRGYEDPPDDLELLEVLTRQFEADKVPVGEVWLASGTFDAIATIMQKTIAPGDVIGVEDPCFMTTLGFARQAGYGTHAMPADEEGVTPEGLRAALKAGVKTVILTPRAHNPMGGSWTKARHAALQEVLKAYPDVLLIEDDHYAVLSRYPAVTLVSPDRPMWAIIRSVSKYIGPDLRLAAVNSSRELARACLSLNAFTSRWVSSILQRAVLNVLTAPNYAKLVAAAAATYDRRREGAVKALAAQGIPAFGRDGMNVWIPVEDEQTALRWLLEGGWTVRAGSIFRLSSRPGIRITISAMDSELAEDFAKSMAAVRRYDLVERGA